MRPNLHKPYAGTPFVAREQGIALVTLGQCTVSAYLVKDYLHTIISKQNTISSYMSKKQKKARKLRQKPASKPLQGLCFRFLKTCSL